MPGQGPDGPAHRDGAVRTGRYARGGRLRRRRAVAGVRPRTDRAAGRLRDVGPRPGRRRRRRRHPAGPAAGRARRRQAARAPQEAAAPGAARAGGLRCGAGRPAGPRQRFRAGLGRPRRLGGGAGRPLGLRPAVPVRHAVARPLLGRRRLPRPRRLRVRGRHRRYGRYAARVRRRHGDEPEPCGHRRRHGRRCRAAPGGARPAHRDRPVAELRGLPVPDRPVPARHPHPAGRPVRLEGLPRRHPDLLVDLRGRLGRHLPAGRPGGRRVPDRGLPRRLHRPERLRRLPRPAVADRDGDRHREHVPERVERAVPGGGVAAQRGDRRVRQRPGRAGLVPALTSTPGTGPDVSSRRGGVPRSP
ncbi:putative Uncharacterized 50.6 kDa protein in the 5\\'region of gyrA and gyrB [Actinacidiphila cocklensis]|uniref:Uncharacterized 50.6 kDa protein in the 5\'region of gyrA and gyrB n=1 Tax=Actinacidiphila cocklensis TaxID=887465 RepID=A0A9W4DQ49_9ACTN|nr:putative Uncharacterized 50.6 kDa protein in the 5\\'region of gyrA and gyrB [Actinacidiphila cocklensis]